VSTFFEQNQTDFFAVMMAEAVEHAERHGFDPHEDYDGWAYVVGTTAGVFRVVSQLEGRVQVEVVGPVSSLSLQEIDLRTCFGGVHPDAVFMDILEEALVDAKRRAHRHGNS
jgi:hypothetical protein